jgi:hypothetical protein
MKYKINNLIETSLAAERKIREKSLSMLRDEMLRLKELIASMHDAVAGDPTAQYYQQNAIVTEPPIAVPGVNHRRIQLERIKRQLETNHIEEIDRTIEPSVETENSYGFGSKSSIGTKKTSAEKKHRFADLTQCKNSKVCKDCDYCRYAPVSICQQPVTRTNKLITLEKLTRSRSPEPTTTTPGPSFAKIITSRDNRLVFTIPRNVTDDEEEH